MKHESCPELYTCHRVRMTPLIRVLLHCTAAEAMESICAGCDRLQSESEDDGNHAAPSGREVQVIVDEESEHAARVLVGPQSHD